MDMHLYLFMQCVLRPQRRRSGRIGDGQRSSFETVTLPGGARTNVFASRVVPPSAAAAEGTALGSLGFQANSGAAARLGPASGSFVPAAACCCMWLPCCRTGLQRLQHSGTYT